MKSPKVVECAMILISCCWPSSFDPCSYLNKLLVAGVTKNKNQFVRAYLVTPKILI